jgi:phosphatidylethanolamine-binding protein (PEBP) family uncharacterized protein
MNIMRIERLQRAMAFMLLVIAVFIAGCGNSSGQTEGGSTEMTVTSENLHNGVWDDVITNTSAGENLSPELTWSAVDGAEEYAIYMIDPDGHNWLHWRVTGFTGTHLDEGETPDGSEYVGPYPPSGTHRYIVTVYALKAEPDSIPGNFDSSNSGTSKIEKALDTAGGTTGNIIAKGTLEGTYTAK